MRIQRLVVLFFVLLLALLISLCPLSYTASGHAHFNLYDHGILQYDHPDTIIPSGYTDSSGDVIVYSVYTVETPDGLIRLGFPTGAIDSERELVITQESSEAWPSPPDGYSWASTCFSVNGVGTLDKDVGIRVRYSDDDLTAADGSPYLLVLARYDETESEWVVLDTTTDASNETLKCMTEAFSKVAVLVKEPAEGALGIPLGLSVIFGLAIGLTGAIAIAIVLDRKLGGRKTPIVPDPAEERPSPSD